MVIPRILKYTWMHNMHLFKNSWFSLNIQYIIVQINDFHNQGYKISSVNQWFICSTKRQKSQHSRPQRFQDTEDFSHNSFQQNTQKKLQKRKTWKKKLKSWWKPSMGGRIVTRKSCEIPGMPSSMIPIIRIGRIRGRRARIRKRRSGIVVVTTIRVPKAKKLRGVTIKQRRGGRHLYAECYL